MIGIQTIISQKCRRHPLSQSKGFSECTLHHRKRLALRPTATADNLHLGGFGVQVHTKLYCCPPKQRQQYEANKPLTRMVKIPKRARFNLSGPDAARAKLGPTQTNTQDPDQRMRERLGAVQAFPGDPNTNNGSCGVRFGALPQARSNERPQVRSRGKCCKHHVYDVQVWMWMVEQC